MPRDFVALHLNPGLIECTCRRRIHGQHRKRCRERREAINRERGLLEALTDHDVDWLDSHGWNGRAC